MAMRGIALVFVVCAARAAVNKTALPLPIAYNTEASAGPDGPWWFVTTTVGPQKQKVDLFPGFSASTLVIDASACSGPDAKCPTPVNSSIQTFDAEEASSDAPNSQPSQDIEGNSWGENQANILNLHGFGQYYAEGMALPTGSDDQDVLLTSDEHSMVVSNNYSAQYPGGGSYTLSTGFLSLFAGLEKTSWTTSSGAAITRNRTLPAAYQQGLIPSESFGIHVGSVNFNIAPSLTLGGYDRSRCITEPIVSGGHLATLLGISLGVATGKSSFINLPEGKASGLLRANSSTVSEIKVRPNPGMPYIYLPQDTCDAIASHLPVTYSRDWNLYLWDVDDPAYKEIVRSPHYLSFSFASGGLIRSIDVPFALLNLTLDAPLMQKPTPYFPCSPWHDSVAPFNFGRAFLQSAFFVQNWQEGKVYLAQAPGPEYASPDIEVITDMDTNLRPVSDAPDWYSTWSSTFDAMAKADNDTAIPNNNTAIAARPDENGNKGTSKGVIAGTVVGGIIAITLLTGVIFWQSRRRRQVKEQNSSLETAGSPPPHYKEGLPWSKPELAGEALYEAAADPKSPVELYASLERAKAGRDSPPVELEAEVPRVGR